MIWYPMNAKGLITSSLLGVLLTWQGPPRNRLIVCFIVDILWMTCIFIIRWGKTSMIMGEDFSLLNPSFQIPFSRICWTPSFNYIDWEILLSVGQITFLEHVESPSLPPSPSLGPLPPSLPLFHGNNVNSNIHDMISKCSISSYSS